MIWVCSLARLDETVARTGAGHVVTLIDPATEVPRPAAIAPERHLRVDVNDIVDPMEGRILPGADHVARLLAFGGTWDRRAPLVIHCFAGISRSTAAAFTLACALSPGRDEAVIADRLRAAAPSATPNPRIVALADDQLGRAGRMRAAIAAIGRGSFAAEGEPFMLTLG